MVNVIVQCNRYLSTCKEMSLAIVESSSCESCCEFDPSGSEPLSVKRNK
jgi:hypothetical protein